MDRKKVDTHLYKGQGERKGPLYSHLDPNKLDQTRIYHAIWPTKTTGEF